MVQLLVKDLRIQKQFIALGFVFIGFVFFALGVFEGLPLTVPAAIFSHFLIVVSSKMDERNNNGRMLASFPLRRRDIVTSKYVGIMMFTAIAFLLTSLWRLLAASIFPIEELPWFNFQSVIITMIVMLLFYSIYFPMFFAFGSRLVQILDLIVIFAVGGACLLIIRILELLDINVRSALQKILAVEMTTLLLVAAGGSLLLLIISWRTAIYLYDRKNI